MAGEENSNPERGANKGEYAGEIAVARRIGAGDDASRMAFLAAIRPAVTRVAIDWCHRIAPGSRCRHCGAGVEPGCARFSDAEAKIEERICKNAIHAYKGQTGLAEFVEYLATSDWWFRDYAGPQAESWFSPSRAPYPEAFRADLVQAWAVLAGSESAWAAFQSDFHQHIERTAVSWCHRSVAGRVCRRCKPGAYDADRDCDAASDAYAYLLDRLKSAALASYGGRTALASFVYLCLHDYRWWASFVQTETGKIKMPKALEDESELGQHIYQRVCWGWDNELIADRMHVPLEDVEMTRARIEEKLRSAGRTLSSRKMKLVSLSAVFPDGEEEETRVAEPVSPNISPEVRSEAVKYWSALPVRDRTLLRLVVESGESKEEIAKVLGLTAQQVYGAIYRIRKEMPEWFKVLESKTKPARGSVQIVSGGEDE